MAYSTNPYLPRAGAAALKLLIQDGIPLVVVARKCGIRRSTLSLWHPESDTTGVHVYRAFVEACAPVV